ncbi:hypothetical protein [Spirosoma endbachense]|uniref:DUF995 domain-containing protein n=1 Tax=Spirosoma endbachense TaxID=2666025 RepID=A0A6P1VSU8_9BACT|nr:hypothetical protein [Spirosoma endbachense]QHV95694.1 hypothetical protein GJR95_12045 [Spirosoma endbachense]
MKIVVLLLSLCTMSAATTAFLTTYPGGVASPPKSLVGRWEHTFPKGVWVWTIRPNGTFTLTSKGKTFANGQYRVQNGIYQMNDANCNVNYQGRYRFAFFAKDSLRFSVVEDTCQARRAGTDGTGWKHLADAK